MRIKAIIAYDGNHFHGFQRQSSTRYTVTTKIEEVLSNIGIQSEIRGSGRTDAGVHATGQVIDFEIPKFWHDLDKLKVILNRKLKHIAFKHITAVDENFHARFSAKQRLYRYIFKTTPPSIFEAGHIAYYPKFDPTLLRQALANFEGEHDFSYFHKTGTAMHTPVRHIYQAHYKPYHNAHIIYFKANGFLRAQVRMMVEMAMQVAMGNITLEQQLEQLRVQKRHLTTLAPPEGLYLARIIY
ncbi:MAG: tRNA pseudouridine(38-40) synthase TruA [Campylobacterales bacterium]|nr:tRNA pseudouridine(38-40) synthase TruA [Campylobacterales bacterium]